jgi:hypothetical protein
MYDEEKNISNWADKGSQGKTKISCTGTTNQNEPTKEGRLSFVVLFESPFTSVSTMDEGSNG